MAFYLNKPKSPSPKDALYQFWSKLPSGSGENDENVKSLQTLRRTDRRRIPGNQKSSLELSARVSLNKGKCYQKIPFLIFVF